MRGINSDRNGAHGRNGCHQLVLATRWDVDEATIDSSTFFRAVAADVVLIYRNVRQWHYGDAKVKPYLPFVGITLLGVDALVVLNVLECLIHETSIATLVSIFAAAIDQVLLTQRDQLTSLAEILALKSTSLTNR